MSHLFSNKQRNLQLEIVDLVDEVHEPTPPPPSPPPPARVVVTAAMDAAQEILSQPFVAARFQAWISLSLCAAVEAMKNPNPSKATQINRQAFEFLEASNQKTPVQTREAAIKLLSDIDAWLTKEANPKPAGPNWPTKAQSVRERREQEKNRRKK